MYCTSCGNYVPDEMTYCTKCGKNLSANKEAFSNNTMSIKENLFDKKSIICTFLSLCIFASFTFFNTFSIYIGEGIKFEWLKLGFLDYSVSDRSFSFGKAYDQPLINIMFFALMIIFIASIMCIYTKKHMGIVICSFAYLLVQFTGFVVFAVFIRDFVETLSKLPSRFEGDVTLLTLPGLGLIVSFVIAIIFTFYSIATLRINLK